MQNDIVLSDIAVGLKEIDGKSNRANRNQNTGLKSKEQQSVSNQSAKSTKYNVASDDEERVPNASDVHPSSTICPWCNGVFSLVNRHWKITIGCLFLLILILLIIIIVLISIVSRSPDSDVEPKNGLCNYQVCLNNGTCHIENDNYRCKCLTGFRGRLCEYNICSEVNCLNGGVCDQSGNNTCKCRVGYSGELCEVTPCSDVTCLNRGVCKISDDAFMCDCPSGTTGQYCEHTPCTNDSFQCLNGGTCLFVDNTATCACTKQYYGEACEHYCEHGAEYYGCTFEEGDSRACFLVDATNDDFNWIRQNGSTPTLNTGPSSANNGNWYMYIEASAPVEENHVAKLISKTTLSTCTTCLKFNYHMFGVHTGTLNVYFGTTNVWTKTGNQGDKWQTLVMEISEQVNKALIFEAVRGNGVQGDIAIDDVQLSPGGCP